MKMRKKFLPFAALFFFPFLIHAQESRPVIRFSPFYTQGISFEETRFIESLIQSYLSDIGEVVNFFDESEASGDILFPDSWIGAPDYVISGSIYFEDNNRIFTLEIHNTSTGETSRTTSVHKTVNDLALKARFLVESVFSGRNLTEMAAAEIENDEYEAPETITENVIAGTWRGESGIEMIRLRQGGHGIAFFSSGAQMALAYTIEDNILKVRQISPNMERFYYPLPYGVARALSDEAAPMCWELLLYSGGTHLRGVRISTEARIEDNVLVELLPETTRDSVWVRQPR